VAALRDFRIDTRAIQDGAWIRVNESLYGDLEILTRGFTDEFVDANKQRTKHLASRYGGDSDRIPNADMRELNASLLREYLVLDVRNLTDDDGEVVKAAEFHGLLGDPAYGQLARACWDAAGRVSTQSAEQLEGAVKNSHRLSRSNSNGEQHPTYDRS
jgi:hypothetical protein